MIQSSHEKKAMRPLTLKRDLDLGPILLNHGFTTSTRYDTRFVNLFENPSGGSCVTERTDLGQTDRQDDICSPLHEGWGDISMPVNETVVYSCGLLSKLLIGS